MAEQELLYTIRVNKDTGAIEAVKGEFEGAGKAADKLAESGGKNADVWEKAGHHIQRFAIHAILTGAVIEALKASDAFQQLETSLGAAAAEIVHEVEPALDLVSRGFSGFVAVVLGGVKAISDVIHGQFRKALTDLGDAVEKGGEIASGKLKFAMKEDEKALKVHYEDMLAQDGLGTARRLQILDEWQKKTIELHKQSGEYLQASAKEQADQLSDIDLEFSKLKQQIVTKAHEEERKEKESHAAALLALDKRTEEHQLHEAKDNLEKKIGIIRQHLENERRLLDTSYANGTISAQQYYDRVTALTEDGEGKINDMVQQAVEARTKAIGDNLAKMSEAGAKAYADEIGRHATRQQALKAAAAEEVRILTDQAVKWLAVQEAKAVANAFATLPFPLAAAEAAGIVAVFTALEAGVSVAGGAAAKSLSVPTGGGGGGGGSTYRHAPTAPPQQSRYGGATAQHAAARQAPKTQPHIVINIQAPSGQLDQQTMNAIVESISRKVTS